MSDFMQKLKDAQSAVIDGLVSEYHKLLLPIIHALENAIKEEAPAFLASLDNVAIASIQAGNDVMGVIKHVESAAAAALPQLGGSIALNVLSTAVANKNLAVNGIDTVTHDPVSTASSPEPLQTSIAPPSPVVDAGNVSSPSPDAAQADLGAGTAANDQAASGSAAATQAPLTPPQSDAETDKAGA